MFAASPFASRAGTFTFQYPIRPKPDFDTVDVRATQELPYAQHILYMDEMPTTDALHQVMTRGARIPHRSRRYFAWPPMESFSRRSAAGCRRMPQ